MNIRQTLVCATLSLLCACGGGGGGGNAGPIASITISPAAMSLATGKTQQLTATAKDADGNIAGGVAFTWRSSSPSVASVDASGLVTGLVTGSTTLTATAQGITSPVAEVTVVSTDTAYYIPFSNEATGPITLTGLSLVSAANPSAKPIVVTAAALDGPVLPFVHGYASFYSWKYDPTLMQATSLKPVVEVYASGGHFYRVSLTDPAGGAVQLSNATYVHVCAMYELQEGPVGGSAPNYVGASVDTVPGDNCATAADVQQWIMALSDGPTDAPVVLSAGIYPLAVFWDTRTGLGTGLLVQDGTTLVLFNNNLQPAKTLLTGLTANFPLSFGQIDGTVLLDEETYDGTSVPGTSTDDYYLVTSSGATKVASHSTSSTSTYFSTPSCSFSDFVFGQEAGKQFVFSYPGTSGNLDIYTVAAAGGSPRKVFSAAGTCLDGIAGASSTHAVLEVTTTKSFGDESIGFSGGVSQTPIRLTGFDKATQYSGISFLNGDQAWLFPINGSALPVVDITTGKVLKSFPGMLMAGEAWSGYDATIGVLRSSVVLASVHADSTPCVSTGLEVDAFESVDTTSFNATPMSDGSAFPLCISFTEMAGPGPVIAGNLAPLNKGFTLSALGLSPDDLQLTQGIAKPTSGNNRFLNLLLPTAGYFH